MRVLSLYLDNLDDLTTVESELEKLGSESNIFASYQ